MSGEGRCARDGCSARLYGRDGYCSMSCEDLHRTERERDEARAQRGEARAEVERLTVICEEAGMQLGLLEREVERLRRGIALYEASMREADKSRDLWEWEREDEKWRAFSQD